MYGNININEPLLLSPIGKDYIWGGTRLNDDLAKGIKMTPLAETWECSTHPDGMSIISEKSNNSSEFKGQTLSEVISKYPEMLGTHANRNGDLPILIKFIDAKEDLSIQVHPTDEYAFINEKGQLGKTEMWYIVDAKKNSSLVYGFEHNIMPEELKNSINDGTVEKYLQKVPVKKDDVFFIDAGIVHAIGAGTLLVEIQENSNLTYRLYDYNRIGKDGKKRELHIDKAIEVARLNRDDKPKQPLRSFKFYRGYATDLLCRCKYFQVERLLLNTEIYRELAVFRTNSTSFQVLLCVEGCGVMFWENGKMLNFHKGDCIFIPANSVEFKLHGKSQLLKVNC